MTSTENYFLSELLWAPPSELVNGKTLDFSVKTVLAEECGTGASNCDESKTRTVDCSNIAKKKVCSETSENDNEIVPKTCAEIQGTQDLILDIDLDFFSTRNPFKLMYSEEQYALLKQLYAYVPPDCKTEEVKYRLSDVIFESWVII